MIDDILIVQNLPVSFHVLRHGGELYLIDGGFIGGVGALKKTLESHGWAHLPLRGIIVTHGHLDHILNVGVLAQQYGAWIAAPALDPDCYAGKPTYGGWARVAGLLESIGRPLLRFQPFIPDCLLHDGDVIDIWPGGLHVIALPGHTKGHIGLWAPARRLLFSADLFASYGAFTHLPPAIFNDDSRIIASSIRRALALEPVGVLPNHGDTAAPGVHLARLKKLATRIDARTRALHHRGLPTIHV